MFTRSLVTSLGWPAFRAAVTYPRRKACGETEAGHP